MEDNKIRIHCINNGNYYDISAGTTLSEFSKEVCTVLPDTDDERYRKGVPASNCEATVPVLAALVDHQLKELDFRMMMPHEVEFIGYNHPDGRRTYIRSLCFVLQKAVRELFPDKTLVIDYSLPSGLYCEIREREKSIAGTGETQAKDEDGRPVIHPVNVQDLTAIRTRMQEIVKEDLPLEKRKLTSEEAIRIFEENGQPVKARLVKSLGRYTFSVYFIEKQTSGGMESVADTFYGPLVPSTGYLGCFAISGFKDGFCLQYPMEGNTTKIEPMIKQSKIAASLQRDRYSQQGNTERRGCQPHQPGRGTARKGLCRDSGPDIPSESQDQDCIHCRTVKQWQDFHLPEIGRTVQGPRAQP